MRSFFRNPIPPRARIALGIGAFALVVRLSALVRLWQSPHSMAEQSDMQFYQAWALRILGGEWTDHHAFIATPGYPFLLAGIYAVAGVHPLIVGIFNAIAESLLAVVLFALGIAIFADRDDGGRSATWVGVGAAAGWIFFGSAQAYALLLMPTSLVMLAFWSLVLWCVWSSKKTASVPAWHFAAAGTGIGLAATLIATILFSIPLVLAAAVAQARRQTTGWLRTRRFFLTAACALAGVALGTSPCWLHNYAVAKEPVLLSAHAGLNFWIGNNPTSNGYPQVPPGLKASDRGMLKDSFSVPPRMLGLEMSRAEVSRFWASRAQAFIREHPAQWLKVMLLKIGKFWSGHEYDDLGVLTAFRDENISFGFISFGLATILGVPAAFFAVRRSRAAWWIVSAVALHLCALLPVFITERYRMAAAPGLILFSAFAMWWCAQAIRARSWLPLGTYLALALAVASWVTSPQSETGVPGLDDYNAGVHALENNDLDTAERSLRNAAAILPDHAATNAALGALAMKRGQLDLAKPFLRRAVGRDPQNTDALVNLAIIALAENDRAAAIRLLQAALAADPDCASAVALLAKTK